MEDISADDDLLSDILLDGLEFDPPISTHKMNQTYRSPRYETNFIMALLKQRVIVEADVNAALDELSRLQTIQRHLLPKTERQAQAFYAHARRYLETYLPDSGVEFALTARYKRPHPAKLRADAAAAAAAAAAQAAAGEASGSASADAAPVAAPSAKRKGKARASGEAAATPLNQPPGHPRADLCVVALRPYRAGEIVLCKGGVKDLTRDEDVALREEAAASRDGRDGKYAGVLGPGRDFSIIRSARKGCSQLLLGPARFVNHDCRPNCEFYRIGQTQMAFKTIRPIALNEEITTYYGDNYFEWANSECLCATCEANGKGAFAAPPDAAATAADGSVEGEAGGATPSDTPAEETSNGRRTSGRRSIPTKRADHSPSLPPESPLPTTAPGSEASSSSRGSTRSFTHHISDREAFPYLDNTAPRGPRCICLTCGAAHWALEAWWKPDECRRCERHYRIYKADWPVRKPDAKLQETMRSESLKELKKYAGKPMAKGRTKRGAEPIDVDADFVEPAPSSSKRRGKTTASTKAAASNLVARRATDETGSERSTPIKLSPLRDARPPDPGGEGARKSTRRGRGSASNASEDAESGASEGQVQPKQEPRTVGPLDTDESELSEIEDMDEDEDGDATLTTTMAAAVLDEKAEVKKDADSVSSSDSDQPSAPKMLGPQARTETLALFWGAADGGRRQRRQSSNAPERFIQPAAASSSRGAKAGTRRGSGRLRSASGASSHTASSRFANMQVDDEEDDDEADEELPKRSHKKKRVELSSNSDDEAVDAAPAPAQSEFARTHRKKMSLPSNVTSASASSESNGHDEAAGPARRASLPAPPEPKQPQPRTSSRDGTSGSSSPASGGFALATQGAERTSVKNLAAFWSAGVEGGGGRTRRQVHREPTTIIPAPERNVPAKRARISAAKNGASSEDSRSATPEVKRPRGGGRTGKVRMSDGALSEGGSGGSNNGKRYDDMDVDEPSTSSQPGGSSVGWPGAMPGSTKAPFARLSGGSIPGSSSAAQGFAPRHASASPLAGPPPELPPTRKNLRWGRPKSSTSRPLASTSAGAPGGRGGATSASPVTTHATLPAASPSAAAGSSISGAMLNLGSRVPYGTAVPLQAHTSPSPGYAARPSSPLTKLSSYASSSDDAQFKVPASPVASSAALPMSTAGAAFAQLEAPAGSSSASSAQLAPLQPQAAQPVKLEQRLEAAQAEQSSAPPPSVSAPAVLDPQLAPAPAALAAMPLNGAALLQPEPAQPLELVQPHAQVQQQGASFVPPVPPEAAPESGSTS